MKQPVKNIVLTACFSILIFHFSMVFWYSYRPGKFSFYYVYPYFHQNWNFFVPPPDTNYHLYAIYQDGELKRADLFEEILSLHRNNRFRGSESLLIALSNCIHYFEKNAGAVTLTQIQDGINFSMIERFARNYLEHKNKKKPTQLKLILTTTNVATKEMKIYHN